MQPYVLAIDQGTTGSTVMVFDAAGRVRGRGYSEFRQYYPRPGWVEHDAEEIWTVTTRVIRSALRAARLRPSDVTAIGITNQRETTVLWDRQTGKPVHRAIVWQDRRTAALCDTLKQGGAEAGVHAKTGLVIDPYFSGTKLHWLFEHVPRARARGRAPGVRHHRQLAHLEADRRPRARHRLHQRVAHHALQHPRAAVGRRPAAPVRRAR